MPSILSRLRGLGAPLALDEPLRLADASGGGPAAKRIYRDATATGTVNIDWSSYDEARLTLTGNLTLTFSGALDGRGYIIKFKQDGTGGHTVTLPSGVRYSADITVYTATSAAGAIDRIGFLYDGDDSKYDFVSMVRNLA